MRSGKSIFYSGILVLYFIISMSQGSSAYYNPGDRSAVLSRENNRIDRAGAFASRKDNSKGEHKAKYKQDELLIKFKPSASDSRRKQIHAKHGSQAKKEFKSLHLHHVKLKPGLSVEEAITSYKAEPDVEYAEPNYIVHALNTPNDPLFSELWGLHNTGQTGGTPGADIKAPEAWDITTGSNDVVVAVIDTGVDYTHEDLAANMWVNPGETGLDAYGRDKATNGIDDDGDGYIDDVHGINAITGSGNPMDDNGHGTHVSGTIGAVGNNGIGVVGVNWHVKIMPCKFLNQSGSGYISDAIECLQYIKAMKDKGVNVVATNNSWGCRGGDCFSQAMYDAINAQREILFIAAAGNSAANTDTSEFYPANYTCPNVISVAATYHDDSMAWFSNYGSRSVHVGAPGQDIVSLRAVGTDMYGNGQHFIPAYDPSAKYYKASGTSMATPHVTGLAALLKADNSGRDWKAIKNLILSGGDTMPSLDGKTITGKRLNAYGSLTCSDKPVFSVLRLPRSISSGKPQVLSALSINCGSSVGAVTVTTADGESIPLHDDGLAPDLAAGDGIFSGTWTPTQESEILNFTFSSPFGTTTESFFVHSPCFGIVCNDGDPCTIDTCDPDTGNCVFTPRCEDNNVCTIDTCDAATGNCTHTPTAVCIDTVNNNITQIGPDNKIISGTNDVHFTWDGTRKITVARGRDFPGGEDQVPNATLSTDCYDSIFGPFLLHDVAIYGLGTYTVFTGCPAGRPGCEQGIPITFTVGPGELGAHMLLDYGIDKDLDVVNIWTQHAAFTPSPLWTGKCGANPAGTVWDWMSKDWNGDSIDGFPFEEGTYAGSSFNVNVMGGIPPLCVGKVCNDNNPCTTDSCNEENGDCVFTPVVCNDDNACTNDTCDPATGKCSYTPTAVCITTAHNNMTVLDQYGALFVGTNDVAFTWDGTKKTSVASSGQVSNATLSSPCLIAGYFEWRAHDVAVYGPGTYTIYVGCPPGSPGCGTGIPISFTVGSEEIGIHMLVDWAFSSNSDVVNVLKPNAAFGPSPFWAGGCGSNPADKVWNWTSYDFDGDGINGTPMVNYKLNVNFNLSAGSPTLCDDAVTRCDDNNACTVDTCDPRNGNCVHTPRNCDDYNACTSDTCDPVIGCVFTPTIVCNDNNACTSDTCDPATGNCVFTPIDCNDNNACTTDTCDPATGCIHTLTVCNDNIPCTIGTCNPATGTCVFKPNTCDDDNICTADYCDAATDSCIHIPTSSVCVNTFNNNATLLGIYGQVLGGANDVHFTWDGTLKTTVVESGQVSNATISSACIFKDTYWSTHDVAIYGPGTYTVYADCPAGSPGCGLGDPITFTVGPGEMGVHFLVDLRYFKDFYSDETNIDVVNVWTPKAMFSPSLLLESGCGFNSAATVWDWMSKDIDGDGINGLRSFEGILNALGASANINVMGVPVPPPYCSIDADCDDNNICTADTCVNHACVRTLIVCNDNNLCTTDICNPAKGCVYTPVVCNDDDACTTDTCDPVIGCVYTPTIVCNDNNACTTDICDPATGNCVFTPIKCNDNNACTIDTCDPVIGCIHTPIDNCIVETIGNNFTMIDSAGHTFGGTNDVRFTWDGTRRASVAISGQVSNAALSSSCPFFGRTWAVHDLAIYGPGTYTIYDGCPAKSPGCGSGNPVTFTVGPNEIGGHMLFYWGGSDNMDIVNVWKPSQVFGPSAMLDNVLVKGSDGGCGTCDPNKVWDWMSYDWDQKLPYTNGAPMTDGPFGGSSANFNLMGIVVDPCEGLVCNDNNPCTTDYCDPLTHKCVFKPACNDNNVCTTDTCDPSSGCIYNNVADGTECDDGTVCTVNDSCQSGKCQGTPTTVCVDTFNNNFTMINSGVSTGITGGSNDIRFTWDGSLKASVAASGQTPNATLSSSCSFFGFTWSAHDIAIYGPGSYTVYTACPAGSPGCGLVEPGYPPIIFNVGQGELGIHALLDWNVGKDFDLVNVWKPKAVFGPSPMCSDVTNCSNQDPCGANPPDKVWDWMSKDWDGDGKNGSPFVDGPFTGFSWNFNVMGIPPCTPPAAGFCDDNNVCTDDGYDSTVPGPGVCPCTHINNTAPCNDNNPCTANDVCSNGVCQPGAPVSGCCNIDAECTDNDICTVDTCVNHACVHIPVVPPQCNDNNACTTDGCTANHCTYTNNTLPCDDGIFCNGSDACSGGTCSVHSGNPCKSGTTCNEFTDHCDLIVVTDCTGHPAGTPCDDNNACSANDVCKKIGKKMVCAGTPVENGTSCDDGDPCTVNDSCHGGKCKGKAKDCNDHNICTTDTCDAKTGQCMHTFHKPKSVTLIGDQHSGETFSQNKQIQTLFTVTNDGCIVSTSGNNKVHFSVGSVVDVNCKAGIGPNPTTIKLDGVSQPITSRTGTIKCPTATSAHTIYLDNLKAAGGKDKDNLYLYGNAHD